MAALPSIHYVTEVFGDNSDNENIFVFSEFEGVGISDTEKLKEVCEREREREREREILMGERHK